MRARRAFTLVELLVVIAIIGILIAMLLPAVQAAREAARRTQCINKMKQLGLALQNYHAARRVFPQGHVSSETSGCQGSSSGFPMAPWTVLILPYMERQPLQDTFRLKEQFTTTTNVPGSPINDAAFRQNNPDFQCPSDPNSQSNVNNCNYFGVQGGGDISLASCTTSSQQRVYYDNGVLFFNSKIRIKDVTDGSNHTFLLGETKYQLTPTGRPDGIHLSWSAGSHSHPDSGRPAVLAAAVIPINSLPFDGGSTDTLHYHTRLFGSFHAGGCHFIMCDGSGHFVSENIDLAVYRFLARRNDGQVVTGL
jgi:prepilin-type N-terminal cleavage/methylation domain-containing protein